MRCGEPTATRRANGRAVLAAGMLAVAVVAFVAAVRDDGATVLMGDDIAKDALHDMGMLSRAKEKAIAGGIKSAKAEKGYFTSAFDAAFNKGWRDAGYKARRAARKEHVVTHLGGHSITGVTESRFVNSMVGAQDLVARVQSLAETKLAEGLCAKQDVIVEKLTQLLDRLKRESGIINITDTEAYQKMMLENSVYLEVESVYQMSQEKHVDEKGEEQYATDQFEVQKRIEDLTKTDLKTLIEEYPGKKEKIDGERGVVLELIDMVEKIDENNLGDVGRRQSLRSALQRTSSALSEVSHGAKWGKRGVRAAAALRLLSRKLVRQARKLGGGGRGREMALVSKSDVDNTKQQVLKILYELLKEPDFRAHLLKKGVEAAEAALKKAQQDKQKAEQALADKGEASDKSEYEGDEKNMDRDKDKGKAFVSTEEYKREHEAFLKEYGPLMREIYILETLRSKIIKYCETGVWEKGFSLPQTKEEEAHRILKAMRAATQGLARYEESGGGL